METAKIFKHGGSQAVRLPKAFRVPGTEVLLERTADGILIKPLPQSQFQGIRRWRVRFPGGMELERKQSGRKQERDLSW